MLFSIIFSIFFGLINAFPGGKNVSITNPTVVTPLGTIEGTTMNTRHGKTIFAFRGIPYAKPPVGDLRFQPPEPVEKWENTLDATKDGFACPQPSYDRVSEDCLVLNVYSTSLPISNKNPKRPVIVYFHAGGFYAVSGLSSSAGPQYLMDKDIVLVTPNYRLASLGFLSTGTKEAPGNNGLKDQVQVLRWIKQNIEAFGGDPDSVTIAGYSAGGSSVTLHMVSPMSQGLFHRAIAMSGSSVSKGLPTQQLDVAKKQARLMDCPDTTPAKILQCLKTKSAKDIGNSFSGFQEFGMTLAVWGPVIEPDFGQERFIAEDPAELYRKGEHAIVPFMTGITEFEFGWLAFNVLNNATLLKEMNEEFNRVAPIAFFYERNTDRSHEISNSLRKFYFDDKPIDNTTFTALMELYADGVIGFPVHRMAQTLALSNNVPVYYYKFTYKGRYSHFYLPGSNNTVPYGAVHHDDLIYLFQGIAQFKDSDPESKVVDLMTTIWSNFARTGNPTPEAPQLWKQLTPENKKYMVIDDKLSMEEGLYEDRYKIWDEVFPLNTKGK